MCGSTATPGGSAAGVKAWDPIASIPRDRTIRIMPLGASITHGQGSAKAGSRSVLHRLLKEDKISHVFVGSNKAQPGDLPANQQNHEGHPGWTIASIPGKTQGLQDPLGKWIPAAKPDYVHILVGSTNIANNYKLGEIGNRLEKLIDTINNRQTGLAKNATIIVSTLPRINDPKPEAESKKYREKVKEIVVKQRRAGMKVGFIDVNATLKPEHLKDFLHPNDKRYEIISRLWFDRMMGR